METSLANLPSLTERLRRFSNGDQNMAESVLREILPDLHRIATRALGREQQQQMVSPTELINESWLRVIRRGRWQIENRKHFYAIAALAMRQTLVDLARLHRAQRRIPREGLVCFDEQSSVCSESPDLENIIQVGILMEKLDRRNPELARVIDLYYFFGFTLEEIADLTGLTFSQVRHRWERGRDWLKDRLDP